MGRVTWDAHAAPARRRCAPLVASHVVSASHVKHQHYLTHSRRARVRSNHAPLAGRAASRHGQDHHTSRQSYSLYHTAHAYYGEVLSAKRTRTCITTLPSARARRSLVDRKTDNRNLPSSLILEAGPWCLHLRKHRSRPCERVISLAGGECGADTTCIVLSLGRPRIHSTRDGAVRFESIRTRLLNPPERPRRKHRRRNHTMMLCAREMRLCAASSA